LVANVHAQEKLLCLIQKRTELNLYAIATCSIRCVPAVTSSPVAQFTN